MVNKTGLVPFPPQQFGVFAFPRSLFLHPYSHGKHRQFLAGWFAKKLEKSDSI